MTDLDLNSYYICLVLFDTKTLCEYSPFPMSDIGFSMSDIVFSRSVIEISRSDIRKHLATH